MSNADWYTTQRCCCCVVFTGFVCSGHLCSVEQSLLSSLRVASDSVWLWKAGERQTVLLTDITLNYNLTSNMLKHYGQTIGNVYMYELKYTGKH